MSRPATLPRWATNVSTTTTPSSGAQDTGFVPGDAAAAKIVNWLINLIYTWIVWFDAGKDDLTAAYGAREVSAALDASTQVTVMTNPNIVYAFAAKPSGRVVAVGTAGKIYTSDNSGATWGSRTAAGGYTDDFADVIYVGGSIGLFVAVGVSGEIQTSPDGATWTHRATAANNLQRVLYNGTEFVAVGSNGGVTEKSTNGTTWSAGGTINAGDFFANSLAYIGSTWVVSGISTVPARDKTLYVSTNAGTTWTAVTLSSGSVLGAAEYTQGLVCPVGHAVFLAIVVGGGTTRIIRSTNGTTWAAAFDTGASVASVFGCGSHGVLLAPQASHNSGWASRDGGVTWNEMYQPGYGAMGRLQLLTWSATPNGPAARRWFGCGINGATDDRGKAYYSRMFTV